MRAPVLLVCLLSVLLPLFAVGAPRPAAGESLAADGRAGVVRAVQGLARVRPDGRQRHSPLAEKDRIFPGDLLLTGGRGAHALELALGPGEVVLGPGAQAEVLAGGLWLLQGEAEVRGTAAAPLTVTGPGGFEQRVQGTLWLKAHAGRAEPLAEEPRWLKGYRAASGNEWMGALLATIDGREVPLVVSRYRADVEVRDQIARTTIEQAFRNTTDQRLEGVFVFPLPADASISGFGMWIGGELVEADVVERQRARQIYEDILKRKKDPGLLEWEGGNLFRARVFPIEPHSEKRIRIRYTQVLPLEGTTWRYRLALRSEMLRSKPLRELALTVRVTSTQALQAVASPTHECRIRHTAHEAVVEHGAQEVRPDRDFEVAVTLAGHADLLTIPHRRGEDGWFALLLAPPEEGGGPFARDLVPEGPPLDLVLVADTSGSMDAPAREGQARFLEALLAYGAPTDRFRLLAGDRRPHWLVEEPQPVTPETAGRALAALAARPSLGWTDLDALLGQALAAAGPGALVVYVGDGVGTTGAADPVAQAARLVALAPGARAAVHAVAPSAAYEAGVLEAMARIGPGSVRAVGDAPEAAARALLDEALKPVLRDARVRIEGLVTARVYPERLPNVPAGRQQVIVGRYLPAAGPQEGTVVVEGTLGGKPVRYRAPLVVPAADGGNDFLPRLWARRHLDALLAQGLSPEVRAEIVEFSARFGILTPLTSLLVLENDEERERYGVLRRVQIRDGERFFAEARDRANQEIRRQAMRGAGRWRAGLREEALRELARLGRDLHVPADWHVDDEGEAVAVGDWGLGVDGLEIAGATEGLGAPFGTMGGGSRGDPRLWLGDEVAQDAGAEGYGAVRGALAPPSPSPAYATGAAPPPGAPAERGRAEGLKGDDGPEPESSVEDFDAGEELERRAYGKDARLRRAQAGRALEDWGAGGAAAGLAEWHLGWQSALRRWEERRPLGLAWLGFPRLAPPPATPPPPVDRAGWTPEVRALLEALVRREALGAAPEGAYVEVVAESLHGPDADPRALAHSTAWITADGWRVDHGGAEAAARSEWTRAGRRGTWAGDTRLARTRAATAEDLRAWSLPLWDLATPEPLRAWIEQGWTVELVSGADAEGRARLRFTAPDPRPATVEWTVDVPRRLVLEEVHRDAAGTPTHTVTYTEPFEALGRWWAARALVRDRDGLPVRRVGLALRALGAEGWAAAGAALDARLEAAVVLDGRLPPRAEALDARRAGRATTATHLALVLAYAREGRWEEARAAFEPLAAAQAGRLGVEWMRGPLLLDGRAGESARPWLAALRARLDAYEGVDGAAAAFRLLNLAGRVLGPAQVLEWLDGEAQRLQAPGAPGAALRRWRFEQARAEALARAGREAEARAAQEALARDWPTRWEAQLGWQQVLLGEERFAEADAALVALLTPAGRFSRAERAGLWSRLSDLRRERGRLAEAEAALKAWEAEDPKDAEATWRRLSLAYLRGRAGAADQEVLDLLARRPAAADLLDRGTTGPIGAAVRLALGDGWGFHVGRVLPEFEPALLALAEHLLALDAWRLDLLAQITGDWRFRRTNAAARLDLAQRDLLLAPRAGARLALERLAFLIDRDAWRAEGAAPKAVDALALDLRARHDAETHAHARAEVARLLLALLEGRGAREEALAFRRDRLASAPPADAPARARELFDALLATPEHDPAAGRERLLEALGLLARLTDPARGPGEQAARAAADLRRLSDDALAWLKARGLPPAAEQAAWPRAERLERVKAATQAARREWIAILAEAHAPEAAEPWREVERLGHAVELGEDLPTHLAKARALLLGPAPFAEHPAGRVWRERVAVALAYGAARRNAPQGAVESALSAFDELGARAPTDEAAREALPEGARPLDWRYHTFRLLLAVDRPEELLHRLAAWDEPASAEVRWRVARATLEAELGRLAEAARRLEAAAALGEPGAAAWLALAEWHLALGEDARRAHALRAAYAALPEGDLANLLGGHAPRRRPATGGSHVEPETLPMLSALMRKARAPAAYQWIVERLYGGSRDFRVLGAASDGLLGHAPEPGYAYLDVLGRLVDGVNEEATLAEWARALEALAGTAATPGERRRIDLLRARVLARASQATRGDPAHGEQALALLAGALAGPFEPGEHRHVAAWLRSLGRIEDPRAARALVAHLGRLVREASGAERVQVGHALADVLWGHGERRDALERIEAVVAEGRGLEGAEAARATGEAEAAWVGWLAEAGHFLQAEAIVLARLARAPHPRARREVEDQADAIRRRAFEAGGRVSLGQGAALFDALLARWDARLRAEPAHEGRRVREVAELFEAAHKLGRLPNLGPRFEAWARATLPWLAEAVPLAAAGHAERLARTLWQLVSPGAALGYLLDALDQEPAWLGRAEGDLWRGAHGLLALLRAKAGAIGALEGRLLPRVRAALDLWLREGGRAEGTAFWSAGNSAFWAERAGDFVATALRVAELLPEDAAATRRAAQVLRHNLRRPREAISVLLAAQARGALPEGDRRTLALWLTEDDRHAEALPLWAALAAERPERLDHAIQHAHSVGRVEGGAAALVRLEAIEGAWKARGAYDEGVAFALGELAARLALSARAAGWIEDAIARRIEATGYAGGRDDRLSRYYGALATARAAEGRTDEAVAAASAGLFSANPSNRRALERATKDLEEALRRAQDLGAWVARYEARVAREGADAPVLRRTLARVLRERGDLAGAARHLEAAVEVEPGDPALWSDLVAVYDAAGQGEAALAARLRSVAAAPYDLEAYLDLGRRMDALGRADAAERARSTLVEMAPHQPDGHRLLAGFLEGARRHEEALGRWEQVVRTDPLRGSGFLSLARVQIRLGRTAEARATLEHVLATAWVEERAEVHAEAGRLLASLGR